jgi:hypothetical protein
LNQLESPHKAKKSKHDDPFWIRGYTFERFLFGGLSLLFIVIMVMLAPISLGAEDKGPVIFLNGFLLLMQSLPFYMIYRSFSWLYIYKEGIWIHQPFRRDRFLKWGDIARIRSSPWGSTVVLSDASGKIKARVYGSHRHSENFMHWFIQERPDLWKPEEGLSFRTSSIFSMLLLFGACFELVMGFSWGSVRDWGFWFALGLAAGTLAFLWMMPMSIRLQEDNLVLRYPFRERPVSAHDIASMTAVYAPMGYIEIRLKEEKTITLLMFSLGINLLHAFLWSWHASWTRPNLMRGSWGPGGVRIPRQLTTLQMLNPPDKQKPSA